ncbi:hypothetical protein [Alienimonas californiensis]|uniref:Uncharacterized protein n=1 Tax=Alienimonas californiensis TaxID=2527989 RepID=A0A517P666_9PLAN|nr:hypothetical protein [Alienimonas californiensis]QDT14878.1 hypothetical protein CA12_09580 [Alienimonas californiensis]
MLVQLTDLDELVLSIRDSESRAYATEALNSLRSGCLRSSVVATWVAVTYDIIIKLRELREDGDAAAGDFCNSFDQAVADYEQGNSQALLRLQQYENSLLKVANEDFELVSASERRDLERLREDRHLCVHPAFSSQSTLYQPSVEGVRSHLVHAVNHLLRHPPVQGKAALKKLEADLQRSSFPSTQEEVDNFMKERHFSRVKASLFPNYITVLCKCLIRGSTSIPESSDWKVAMCLVAASRYDRYVYDSTMKSAIPTLTESSDDSQFLRLPLAILFEPRIWNWLTGPTQLRMQTYLRNAPVTLNELSKIFRGYNVAAFKEVLKERFDGLPEESKLKIITEQPSRGFVDEAISLYRTYGGTGWRRAEAVAENAILPLAEYFNADAVREVLKVVDEVNDVQSAHGTPAQMAALFDATASTRAATRDDWANLYRSLRSKGRYYSPLQQSLASSGILEDVAEDMP